MNVEKLKLSKKNKTNKYLIAVKDSSDKNTRTVTNVENYWRNET